MLSQLDCRDLGGSRPAVGGDPAVPRIEAETDPAGKPVTELAKPIGIARRAGSQHHSLYSQIEQLGYGFGRPDPAAELAWYARPAENRLQHSSMGQLATARTIQVDHMEPAGALVHPQASHRSRIVVKDRLLVVVSLTQSDTTSTAQINCRKHVHPKPLTLWEPFRPTGVPKRQ